MSLRKHIYRKNYYYFYYYHNYYDKKAFYALNIVFENIANIKTDIKIFILSTVYSILSLILFILDRLIEVNYLC
jgi:hypothetical protein